MDQRTNGPTDQWTDGPMDQWTDGPMDQRTDGPTDRWTNGPMDQWTNRPMGRRTDGPMDRWTNVLMDDPVVRHRIDLHYLLATRTSRASSGVPERNELAMEAEGAMYVRGGGGGGGVRGGGGRGGRGGFHTAAAEVAAASIAAATAAEPADAAGGDASVSEVEGTTALEAWVNLNPSSAPPLGGIGGSHSAAARAGGRSDPPGARIERKLTEEQQAAVDLPIAFSSPGRYRLGAPAGSGKTLTPQHIARRHGMRKRILYLAFNKDVQEDAQNNVFRRDRENGCNVTCKTTHALALGYMQEEMRKKTQVVPGVYEPVVKAVMRNRCRDFNMSANKFDDAAARAVIKAGPSIHTAMRPYLVYRVALLH